LGKYSAKERYRILIAVENKLDCLLLKSLLSRLPFVELVGEAPNSATALEKVKAMTPDAVILEEAPESECSKMLGILAVEFPGVRIIKLSLLNSALRQAVKNKAVQSKAAETQSGDRIWHDSLREFFLAQGETRP
jgi:chemotaxis response regulator CheB